MKLTLRTLIERGMLPQELPPPFNTKSLARFMNRKRAKTLPLRTKKHTRTSKIEIYNLARSGTLRRELAILNPIQFSFLGKTIVDHWRKLHKICMGSKLTLTRPILTDDLRAIGREHSLDVRAVKRAELRSQGRYLLIADVIRFYPSIYTHSVGWALHGKSVTKNNHSRSLLGNEIDEQIRNCQDGQTKSIPVGPDTSFLIAEILLAKVDLALSKNRIKGFRYVDDYELVFDSETDALSALSRLERSLLEFELHLNPVKTKIVTLPQRIEDPWIAELKAADLSPDADNFRSQIFRFFDRAFELARRNPSESILNYAAGRIANIRKWEKDYELVEDLLIQCARVEAGTLPFVLNTILRSGNTTAVRSSKRRDLLFRLILEHAPQRHSSEVAWSLWACIVFKFRLPTKVGRAVLTMEDSVCALLLLHAQSLGLMQSPQDIDSLKSVMKAHELYGNRWLLAYEANVKGWLTSDQAGDHVASEHNFGQLKAAGVNFYDVNQTTLPETPEQHEDLSWFLQRLIPNYSEVVENPPQSDPTIGTES
jgi:hypothetical protein